MPIATRCDEGRDLTISTATGELAFEDHMAALRAFYEGNPSKNVWWDLRRLEGPRISSHELSTLLAFIKTRENKREGGRTILVAPSDLDFGLSRMSQAYADSESLPWPLEVFRTMKNALRWIEGER